MDGESRSKYLYNEEKRMEYLRRFEKIGFDALEYFDRCLQSWPDPDFTHRENKSKEDEVLEAQFTETRRLSKTDPAGSLQFMAKRNSSKPFQLLTKEIMSPYTNVGAEFDEPYIAPVKEERSERG